MNPTLERYRQQATDLRYARPPRWKVMANWQAANLDEIMELADLERANVPWATRMRQLEREGPVGGLGFQGLVLPNAEMVNVPAATTGVTAETNLYTPATTTNAAWSLMPQGSMKAPQTWLCMAGGIYTSSSTSQTSAFTFRLGTSGTPSSNQSLGATGAISLGNATAVTNGLWQVDGIWTMRGPGTSATAMGNFLVAVSNQAAGSVTASQTAMAGNTTATFDMTLQQGFVISVTPSAVGVSVTLTNFVLLASD